MPLKKDNTQYIGIPINNNRERENSLITKIIQIYLYSNMVTKYTNN